MPYCPQCGSLLNTANALCPSCASGGTVIIEPPHQLLVPAWSRTWPAFYAIYSAS